MKRDLGILGGKGEGKDTLTGFLTKGYGYTRLAFGDRLKEKVSKEFSIPLESLHDPKTKEQHRELMQDVGELYRKYNPNIWVLELDEVYKTIARNDQENYRNQNISVILSDIRHKNEFVYAEHYLQSLLIYVERPTNFFSRILQRFDHISESQRFSLRKDCDIIVLNNGGLLDLEWAANKVAVIAETSPYSTDMEPIVINARKRQVTPGSIHQGTVIIP